MKRYFKILASVAAAGVIVAGMQTTAMAADFGRAPTSYQIDAKDYIMSRMEDERGARFQFVGQPYRVMADFGQRGEIPAWAVDVRVRSRLNHGRAPGAATDTVIFVGGTPVALEYDLGRLDRV